MSHDTTPPAQRRTLSLKRTSEPAFEERLHKVLAQAGLGSRRALEERITQGQVRVNGEVASLGSSVTSGDRIELDGKTFVAAMQTETPRVLLYNKPEGEVTTREDPEGRPTVFDRLPQIKGSRWINVGRLDINTTGLLLLTTDGELTHALTHPSTAVTREYVCRIHGEPTEEEVAKLQNGIVLEDGPAKFDEIESIGASDSHAWFRVVLREGRNREVRRLWEALGYQVSRLKRIRYGSLSLPRELLRGHFQELPSEAVEQLRKELQLERGPAVLTLQNVIGQRKAKPTEFRPAPREQRAWTHGSHGDEARELRAFDRIRDEPSGKRSFGKGPRGKGGHGRSIPDDIGNRLTAPGGARPGKPNRRKAAAPGFENPAEQRSWYAPEGVTTTSRIAPPRHVGRPGPGAAGHGKPGGGSYQGKFGGDGARQGKPGGGNGPYQGKPGGGNSPYQGKPGGGNSPYQGKPGGGNGPYQDRSHGNASPYGGKPGGSQGPKGRGKPPSRAGARPGHGAPRTN